MRTSARVVVIGGGAVGAACLYHLTQAGVTDCLLIEKDELTSGSTWHAAGNIPTYANSWLGMRAGNYAWKLYRDLAERVGAPIAYRHTGAFWPAHTKDRMDLFQHLTGVSKSAGFELRMLSPSEMESMHPYYQAGNSVRGAIFDPYEGDIDPSQLTHALVKGARDAGAEVARFTCVTGILRNKDKEWLVETNKGNVTCEIIVNATGFYGEKVGKMVGANLPVATLEHQYLVTEPLEVLEQDAEVFPLVRDPDIRFYLRRERASLLFGSYGHAGRLAFKDGIPENFSHGLFEDSPDDMMELIEQAIEHVPLLGKAGIQRFINGPIGYSPDALPLCGPAAGLPNFYHACGIQIGITHSAAVGKAIAEWVTAGETEWDYSAWDPRRFGDWADAEYASERIVELYDLQYAIPFPHRILQSGRPLQKTPLYNRLLSKGAVFGQVGGWERAFWFDREDVNNPDILSFHNDEPWRSAVRQECEAVRDRVGVMDHGGFTKFEVSGAGATDFLDNVFCNALPKIGKVKLGYLLTPKGKIWSEATIARLEKDQYLLCGPTIADYRDYDWLCNALGNREDVKLNRGSSLDAALLVMGPQSRNLLSLLTQSDLSAEAMPWMSVQEISIGEIQCIAMRVSYVGELGWELHLESKYLERLYQQIESVGVQFELMDFGSYALNCMRIEKSYHGWAADFGTEYTMFDAGLEKFIDLNKANFIGREAVIEQAQSQPEWCFIRLVVESPDFDPLPGDPILQGRRCVGFVTSAATGFRTNKVIALGYINRGTEMRDGFSIESLGRNCAATFCAQATYDPDNRRCRS
ncbi:MAG: FAD-dependent oxidoreductase [Acidiferrobacterales bacterium]|nr:FAD-dependent oxidoreductase [Acidiferrobacterales bacterium]